MYEFISGPLVWISFIVFIGGSLLRLTWMLRLTKKDKVLFPYLSLKYGLRSLVPWIIPFASINMRKRPVLTTISFSFHLCLITTPLFLLSHNLLWHQSWNIRWWSLPGVVADSMTVIVIGSGIFFLLRRLVIPEVQFLTLASDYVLLAIGVLPFLTGFLTYHQWLPYKPMLIAHILSGEIMLITIPFTRLSHMLFFFVPRVYMGSEFDAARDSIKG